MSINVENTNTTEELINVPASLTSDELINIPANLSGGNASSSVNSAGASSRSICSIIGEDNCNATNQCVTAQMCNLCEIELQCTNCQSTCELGTSCQAICETTCLTTCELGTSCQENCEIICQGICESGCQNTCEKACQAGCQENCQNCEGVACQTTQSCTSGCEVACELTCEDTCETTCELSCQYECQDSCQTACQLACQDCQTACELAVQRPDNWTWTSPVEQGIQVSYLDNNPYYLTAEEWNNFTARINLFRTYKGLSAATFTTAVKGQQMMAAQANEAVNAISAMNPSVAVPSAVTSNSPITAQFINGLANSLNSL